MNNNDTYEKEAKARFGNTEAYKQSAERVKKMTPADMERIGKENEALLSEIVEIMHLGAESKEAQQCITKHYEGLRAFYDPTPEIYRGLAEMYKSDPRFMEFYEKRAKGLSQFMSTAMIIYADSVS
jgi:hypothetical protein